MATHPLQIAFAFAVVTASCVALSARQDRSAAILSQARAAIGGEARLGNVTGLSVKATSRSDLDGSNRVPTTIEIDLALPDKFLVDREWPGSFAGVVGGFNGSQVIEQWRTAGKWADTQIGDARQDGRALAVRARELVRYAMAWLLAAPERYQVRFKDAGEADTPQGRADVLVAVGANDFAARLFFDKQTRRLVLMTYSEPPPRLADASSARTPAQAGQGLFSSLEAPKEDPGARRDIKAEITADVRMLLTGYRTDDSILFPHKVRFEVGALTEEWEISRFRVNPRFEPGRFAPRR